MRDDNNKKAFFALLRSGLWEKDVELQNYGTTDFSEVLRLAEEQSVVGLIAAGLEHVKGVKMPPEWTLQFIGQTLQIEQQNKAMNAFIAELVKKMRDEGIYTLLVKGQGIAQCYARPLWRSCGDVDLYLSSENYENAKAFLVPLAQYVEEEDKKRLHLGMTIDGWVVELHGTLYSQLSRRIDRGIEEAHRDVFYGGNVRSWMCGKTQVFLPGIDDDVIFVFTHILQHYFGVGIGLRQICDWCRLLYRYRGELDLRVLELRIKKMGLLPKWKAFAALAVDTLGMPAEAMPLYSTNRRWKKKAERILSLIMESGNFGHGRDTSYKKKHPKLIEYIISFWVFTRYGFKQFLVFPIDAIKGWWKSIRAGVRNKFK